VLALFPRIIDPQDLVNITLPLLDAAAVQHVVLRLGALSVFSTHNPTGRYRLNLSVMQERAVVGCYIR